jgi:hypothetical protein
MGPYICMPPIIYLMNITYLEEDVENGGGGIAQPSTKILEFLSYVT